MHEMVPQVEPPKKSTSMKDVSLSIILVLITICGLIIAAFIFGTTQVIGFDLLVFILACIMLAMTVFFAWFTLRTRQKVQAQYYRDIAEMKRSIQVFKNDITQIRLDESRQWQQWAASFTQSSHQEYMNQAEELKKQCMEAIFIAETKMNSSLESAQYNFSLSVQSLQFAVDSYRQHLIKAMKQMELLEEYIKKELPPEKIDVEQST